MNFQRSNHNTVVLIVGLGQLGSRHLQGLAKYSGPLRIFAVEPNEQNRQIAEKRFYEIEGAKRHVLVFLDLIKPIDVEVDIAIVSTNADIRYKVTLEMISVVVVKYIIFEKVAFQSKEQFESISKILEVKKIKSWVNCPRRSMGSYQQLRTNLRKSDGFHLKVEGSEWGLACNSVHYLDLFFYLTDEKSFYINKASLEKAFYPSKRFGFIEFYGSLEGGNSLNLLTLSCNRDNETKPFNTISIKTDTELIIINEQISQITTIDVLDSKVKSNETFEFINQSSLTHLQVYQIITTGSSDLPSLSSSYRSHSPVLEILLAHYNRVTGNIHLTLPIT